MRYFKTHDGSRVLQKDANGWALWDAQRGVVETLENWDIRLHELTEIDREHAISLMK